MNANPKLYLFSARTIDYLRIGLRFRKWAVVPMDGCDPQSLKQKATIMEGVRTGDVGFFYCQETKCFYTPFTILDPPRIGKINDTLWDERWAGEFTFSPWVDGIPFSGFPITRTGEVFLKAKEESLRLRPRGKHGKPKRLHINNVLRFSGKETLMINPFIDLSDMARLMNVLVVMYYSPRASSMPEAVVA